MADGSDRTSLEEMYGHPPLSGEEIDAILDASLEPRPPEMLFDVAAQLLRGVEEPRILDVGARDARHSAELARRFDARVAALEPVEANLRRARTLLSQDDPDVAARVELVRGFGESLPFDDAAFDLVWIRDVLIHVERLTDVFREVRRVLRPEGRVLVFQMFATPWLEPEEAARLWPPLGAVPSSSDVEQFERAVAEAGLLVESVGDVRSEWREFGEENGDRRTATQMLRAARLIREPQRYVDALGERDYRIELANCLWGVYQMIGKLSPRVYVLRDGG